MNITVEIKAPGLEEALNNLATALGGKAVSVPGPKTEQTQTKEEVKKDKAEKVTAEEIPPSTEVAADAKEKAQDVEFTEEKTYTLEEVREKLSTLSRNGKRAEVKALIEGCGVSKLTEIPSEKYVEVMKKAGEL